MAYRRSLDFLPGVFRTDINNRILTATVDQLISEPELKRLDGYIGRKFAPSYKVTDSYIEETLSSRQDYQLEPATVYKDDLDKVQFVSTYQDLIDRVKALGGITEDHSRLFRAKQYIYDGLFDYDKFMNFSSYYWLPSGPFPVPLSAPRLENYTAITVTPPRNFRTIDGEFEGDTFDTTPFAVSLNPRIRLRDDGYTFSNTTGFNPTLRLARGGTYDFSVDQQGHGFFIQTQSGLNLNENFQKNLFVRDVYGVINNGAEFGTVTFNVPSKDAQDFFINMTDANPVNLVAYSTKKNRRLRYVEVQYRNYQDFLQEHNGIDGGRFIDDKEIVFLPDQAANEVTRDWAAYTSYEANELVRYGNLTYRVESSFTTGRVFSISNLSLYDPFNDWYDPAPYDSDDIGFDMSNYDRGDDLPENLRDGSFKISIGSDGLIKLVPSAVIAYSTRVNVLEGTAFGNRQIYLSDQGLDLIPNITANRDVLYYQDSTDPGAYGIIELVEQETEQPKIDVVTSIIGKKSYTSPNGVIFTNGLKVRFDENVEPASYANKEYYVEGVGSAIRLVDVDKLVTPETYLDVRYVAFDVVPYDTSRLDEAATFPTPTAKEYTTINRASQDGNAWSRLNRWFHEDVLKATAEYTGTVADLQYELRAKRPIIEFQPDLQLYNFGKNALPPVTLIDLTTTDALSQVEGKGVTLADNANTGYISDGTLLQPDTTVIFAADPDPDVRSKIWRVSYIRPQSSTEDRTVSFQGDGVTNEFDLGFTVTDVTRLSVLIDGIRATDAGYNWSLTDSNTITFDNNPPFTAPLSGRNITVYLIYDLQIHLEPLDIAVKADDSVIITEGLINKGYHYRYDGSNWILSQNKLNSNQAPLFALVDKDYANLNSTAYDSTTFAGTKIFGYKQAEAGRIDPELGIRLSYRNLNNVGDIVFSDFITSSNFDYKLDNRIVTTSTKGCMLIKNMPDGTVEYVNQWREKEGNTGQYQTQTYFATVYQRNLFELNVRPQEDSTALLPDNLLIYVNNRALNQGLYDIQIEGARAYLLLDNDLTPGDKLDIKIRSNQYNADSVYEIAQNLEYNALNSEIPSFTMGQIRNHIISVFESTPGFAGEYVGKNNSRDMGNIKKFGGKIAQNLGATHLANFFLNDAQANFVESIVYAQREYIRFKNKMLELVYNIGLPGVAGNSVLLLDEVISELTKNKSELFSYFTSDMLPYGDDYTKLTYVIQDIDVLNFDVSRIYDYTQPNNKALSVYHNGKLLIKGREYVLLDGQPVIQLVLDNANDFFNQSSLTINLGDIIEIREYNNTDGSHIPPTPTKLGLYPLYMPRIITDGHDGNPRPVLRGHDGSYTSLFGDFRDDVLLEFELRIYNNIKVKYDGALSDIKDYIPGAFRTTEYSKAEFERITSSYFNSWLGKSGLAVDDFNVFESNDEWSWNYSSTTNKFDGKRMPAAYWRGIYKHYLDTDAPHLRPWEMLGFSEEPVWWTYYYGPAPYTRGNKVLWDDLEAGRIVDGERKGIDPRYARPKLTSYIPVNESGETLSPFQCFVANYDSLDFSGPFKFGDGGPVETAWKQSSEYPFVIQIAMALMHPAEYFGANIDKNRQIAREFGTDNTQWIYSTNGLRSDPELLLHGELVPGTDEVYRANSYITYITEYATALGLDKTRAVGNKVRDLSVQLAYKVSGFTDKKYIKLYADQASPNSVNASVTIPDEDFQLVINKSAPLQRISYSGIIITKSEQGYTVNGYDDNSPYFTIEVSSTTGRKNVIKVGALQAVKYLDSTRKLIDVPYGTEFLSVDQVVDFLISYGRYLESQGFVFNERLDEDAGFFFDWDLAAREFMFYVQQGWEQDVAISISPAGSKINFTAALGVVDGLNNSYNSSRVITEDFKILRPNQYSVVRQGRNFSIKTDDGSGIYLLDIDVVVYEHVMVLNNLTRFSDVIFEPTIGARQFRIKVAGYKTGDWDGSFGAAGFIINDDNIQEWQSGKNYYKGEIVRLKNAYYTASVNIPGSSEFDNKLWLKSDYDKVKKGLLPNLANRAGSSKQFYDIDAVNLELDADRLGKGLIGLRPRSYFEDMQISDTSQVKFYQGMINQKGSKNSIDKLLRAKLDNFDGSITYNEEWALRTGQYGASGSRELLQLALDEKLASRDPLVIELLDSSDTKTDGRLGYYKNDIYEKAQPYNKNYLGTREYVKLPTDLPTAGYPLLDDVDWTSISLESLNNNVRATQALPGDFIWVARNETNDWSMLRISETGIELDKISINRNGLATITMKGNHNLSVGDYFLIKTVNNLPALSGFFKVKILRSNTSVEVETRFNLLPETKISGQYFNLLDFNFENSAEVLERIPTYGYKTGDKLFIDNASNQGWAVYDKQVSYTANNLFYAYDPDSLESVPDPTVGGEYGHSIAVNKNETFLLVGQPNNQRVYGYQFVIGTNGLSKDVLIPAPSDSIGEFGKQVVMSNIGIGAISAPADQDNIGYVFIARPDLQNGSFIVDQALAPYDLDIGGKYGSAIAISDDGLWLAVGQPGIDGGVVYVYQFRPVPLPPPFTQQFTGDGSTVDFTLTDLAANPENIGSIFVIVNDVTLEPDVDYTLAGDIVTFTEIPELGASINITVVRQRPYEEFPTDGITEVSSVTLTGDTAGVTSPYQVKVTIDNVLQIPFRDYEVVDDEVIFTTPTVGSIRVDRKDYYELVTTLVASDLNNGDRFGASLDLTSDGRRLLVGAPGQNSGAGAVYVFDRMAIEFVGDGESNLFESEVFDGTADPAIYLPSLPRVYLDGVLQALDSGYGFGEYTVDAGSVVFNNAPAVASRILIETNEIYLTDKLLAGDTEEGAEFGSTVKICPTACSVYVGAPYANGPNQKDDVGAVYRFVNQGRFYGVITGTVVNPVVSPGGFLIINDYWIEIPISAGLITVIDLINQANIPGVTAYATDDNRIVIESDSLITGDLLKITADTVLTLEDLGLDIYYQQQKIENPSNSEYGIFGKSIAVMPTADMADIIVIGGERLATKISTIFDADDTTFDRGVTSFSYQPVESGAAFTYQYLGRSDDSLETPGVFIPAETLTSYRIDSFDRFGSSIATSSKSIFVGMPGDDTYAANAGAVLQFSASNPRAWNKIRSQDPKVNINLINRISLVDRQKNQIIADLDFIDPYKGKISGIAEQEIDYITSYDPAVYTDIGNERRVVSTAIPWSKKQVGQLWWNTSRCRWLEYEQGSIDFRVANWNSAFPGSAVIVFEWVESDLPPNQYVDSTNRNARVRNVNQFTKYDYYDEQGIERSKYYFWVSGRSSIPSGTGRKLSAIEVENIIANPKSAGISYAALVAPNAIALYNCTQYLKDADILLSIDYDREENDNNLHAEYQLIAEGDRTSLPAADIITKMIDSLAGSDKSGRLVPDVTLPVGKKYGKEFRPRQTMFYDRTKALSVAVDYLNRVLAETPVLLDKTTTRLLGDAPLPAQSTYDKIVNDYTELNYLIKVTYPLGYRVLVLSDVTVQNRWTIYSLVTNDGDISRYWNLSSVQPYRNSRYLERIDWVDPKVPSAVTDYVVDFYYNLSRVNATPGQTAKVKDDGRGLYSVVQLDDNNQWIYVRREAATVRIKPDLYDLESNSQGFGNDGFDLQIFDDWPNIETQNILTAIYEDVFTVDLDIEKNNWFFMVMQHLLAEQKYVDWLFKTSFIKVQQIQRVIKQIPVFQKEKQDLVRQYVEETKPYHTKLREFVVGYNGIETVLEGMTDFDVPAYYVSQDNRYRSPNGSQIIDNFILDLDEYKPWRDNHKFVLSNIEIINGGSDFVAVPTITILGGGGTGAKAEAFLADGSIVEVKITNPGSGFTSTPSIIIEGGGGVNAILAARLDNNKVRKFDTTLKLDRVSSQSSSFLVQFLDANNAPVDIRQEKLSRISSEAGIIDILLDRLTPTQFGESISGGWLANTQAEIGYPVQSPVYRIFDDTSGRIQVFHRRPEGGLSAAALQELLRESNGGVNGLDISGTTVIVDGSLVDFASANLTWKANTLYNAGDVILFRGVAYRATLAFTSADVFGNDQVMVEVFDDSTINNDEYSENFNSAAEWNSNTSYQSNEYVKHPNGFSLYRVLISFTSGNEFAISPLVKMTGADFNNHIDRLWAYYDPNIGQLGRDITQLLSGIHYPGVKIQGPNFNQDPGFDVGTYDTVAYDSVLESAEGGNLLDPAVLDTVLTSRFTDIALGTRPEDIITAGGGFVDAYNSHAPEEMIPGRVYDTLDIKVYSTPSDAWVNDDSLGMSIVLTSTEVGTNSTFAFVPPLSTADALIVYTANYGRLKEGVDFVGDRVNNSITVNKTLLPDDIIYIYALDTGGTGLLFDGDFVTDGIKKSYDIPVDRNLIGQLYVALDGQRVTNYSLNPTQYEAGVSTVFSTVTFDSAPAAGKSLDIYAFNAASDQQAFVEAKSQNFVSTGNVFPDNYIYSLDTVVGYDYPLLDKIIVEVNGSRLNPPNQSYYAGDGSTIAFDMPSTTYVDPDDVSDSYLKVYVDGVRKNLFEHWEMGASDGSTVLQVVFNEAPAAGSEIVVSYTRGAKYEIVGNNDTLLIDSSVPINVGSEISVLTFTNHNKLKIQTQVYQSTTAVSTTVEVGYDDAVFDSGGYDSVSTVINAGTRYSLNRPVNNISYLWITADVSGSGVGQRLYPGRDFVLINPTEIELRSTLGINPSSFVVVTSFNENTQKPSIGFRIFKDMNDNFEYKRISRNDSTYITQVVSIQDTEIFVNDVSVLADPDVATNTPGAVIIGNELIHYYVKNIATNSISQLRRGVKGTGAIQTISRNTRVYDVSADQTIPNAHTRIWYDQGTNAATNGLGLQYSTTEQAKFLLAKPTLLESRVYDENYMVNGYVTIGYVEGNLYE